MGLRKKMTQIWVSKEKRLDQGGFGRGGQIDENALYKILKELIYVY